MTGAGKKNLRLALAYSLAEMAGLELAGDGLQSGLQLGAQQGAEESGPPAAVREDIREFIRLDNELKAASGEFRLARVQMKRHKGAVLRWMVASGTKQLRLKRHRSLLLVRMRPVRKRPTAAQQEAKLAELQAAGVIDPAVVVKALRECGVSEEQPRLYRRRLGPKKSQ
jgi:hypothetical protein